MAFLVIPLFWLLAEGQQEANIEAKTYTLYSDLSPEANIVLQNVIDNFHTHRQDIIITIIDSSEADILITSFEKGKDLFDQGILTTVEGYGIDQNSYLANAWKALSKGDKVFGLPLFVDFNTLYYRGPNDLPKLNTIDDFIHYNPQGQKLLLNKNFDYIQWSMGIFGASVIDKNRDKLESWFTWLKDMNQSSNIEIHSTQANVVNKVVQGQRVYFVDRTEHFIDYNQRFKVKVTSLPSGTENAAKPLLYGQGLYINNKTIEDTKNILIFGQYLSAPEQEALFIPASKIPANALADTTKDYPQVRILQLQTDSTLPITEVKNASNEMKGMNDLVDRILSDDITIKEALQLIR